MSEKVHVVCPHCDATNRVVAARLSDGAKCGRCTRALFTGHPVELTGESFARHVNASDLPVVVDFWAPWCGPCRVMTPAFAQAAAQLEPRVRFAKLNTEVEQAVAAQYGIRSIPTMIAFRNGREVARQSGALDARGITRWVTANS